MTTVNYSQGEKLERQIPLSAISTSQNPRLSHRGLLELFHEKGAAHNPPEVRAEYVARIDAEYPWIRRRAESIKLHKQIQAVTLRSWRSETDDEYVQKYGIVQGECRILAIGLIEAETGEPQTVRAVVEKLTLEQAFERALVENIEREDMSPLDLSAAFNEMLTSRINPATVKPTLADGTPNPLYDEESPKGRPYTMQEVARKVNRDYHWVRSRAALAYLPAKDKAQVEQDYREGRRDLTRYAKKAAKLATALKAKAKETGEPVEKLLEQVAEVTEPEGIVLTVQKERRRVKGVKEILSLIDATPLDRVERLEAFADVLGITLQALLEEREQRAEAREIRSGREADREARRSQKTA